MPQSDILDFLSDPATHGGVRPRRIDTHISAVFLTGTDVWKLKKAVRMDFLDFRGLDARERACRAELAVNQRAAPDLYLGVVPIIRDDQGHLSLGRDGDSPRHDQVVDWLVHMRPFDQRHLFSRLLGAGRVNRRRIQAVADRIWAFHQGAPHRPDQGGRQGMAGIIDGNLTAMAPFPELLSPAKVAILADQSRQWLDRLTTALEDRRITGLVRQCHGDLHCGNICLFQGTPTLFDAIEFSDRIACIDTFYDLAFLLMDLDQRGHRALASHAMNHYLDLSGDYVGVTLLPLFLSQRAAIRAHVSAATACPASPAPPVPPARRARLQTQATALLDAALAYLSPPRPRLLAVGGLSGSGKSRMGRELAPLLAVPGAAVVRSDSLRKQLSGTPLLDRLGPDGYTSEMTEQTYQTLYDTCLTVLKAGHSVVADAVFAKPEQRDAIARVAQAAQVPFDGLWLHADPALSAHRITQRQANVSDATPDILRQQLTYDLGPMTWTRIDTSGSKDQALALGQAALGLGG